MVSLSLNDKDSQRIPITPQTYLSCVQVQRVDRGVMAAAQALQQQAAFAQELAGDADMAFLELVSAVLQADVTQVDTCLREGPSDLMYRTIRTCRGVSPLTFAVARGNLSVLEVFVRHGAEVDRRDEHGHALLWHACAHGQVSARG